MTEFANEYRSLRNAVRVLDRNGIRVACAIVSSICVSMLKEWSLRAGDNVAVAEAAERALWRSASDSRNEVPGANDVEALSSRIDARVELSGDAWDVAAQGALSVLVASLSVFVSPSAAELWKTIDFLFSMPATLLVDSGVPTDSPDGAYGHRIFQLLNAELLALFSGSLKADEFESTRFRAQRIGEQVLLLLAEEERLERDRSVKDN